MAFKLLNGSSIDVSKHKQMEKLKKKYSDQLEELIKERTKELEAVNEQLEQGIKQRRKAEEKLRFNEMRLEALLKLNQMTMATLKEISEFATEEGVKLTGSNIGFLGFIEEYESKQIMSVYTWSKHSMKECAMKDKIPVFYIDKAGLWGEAIRQRRPIIINDYKAPHPWKKGYPEGHIPLTRLMCIPLFNGDNPVMIAAVGNKQMNYDQSDVKQLTLLMDGVWNFVQRKKAEESLRLSEERFSKVFFSSPVPMIIVSIPNGKYVLANESFLHFTGYCLEEIINRPESELNILNPDYFKKIRQAYREGAVQNLEIKYRKKSGEERTALFSADLIDIQGNECLLCSGIDITELRRYEKEMARLDRLNLIGEMSASISHELRNPMTTVKGFLQLLRERKKYAQEKEFFDLMVSELDRANSIITEFLSLARNKAVEMKMKNLNSILKPLVRLIEADVVKEDKSVILDLGDIPEILLDKKEIHQVILNLTRNGLDAMSPKGCLTIKTFLDGEEVVLAVQDQGKGIEPEVLEKLGTPFFSTKDNGTGLGLAVCYSIAERHKARIDVETGSNGTTFMVRFKV
ncbi:MAG: GAF domain-containing protein [Desulfotomaculaceae bacterium]